jgi:hypothetical protein
MMNKLKINNVSIDDQKVDIVKKFKNEVINLLTNIL